MHTCTYMVPLSCLGVRVNSVARMTAMRAHMCLNDMRNAGGRCLTINERPDQDTQLNVFGGDLEDTLVVYTCTLFNCCIL